MAPSALEKSVANRFAYVDLMVKVGGCEPGLPKHHQLLTDSVCLILATLKTVKGVQVEDAIAIQTMVSKSPLNEEQRTTLLGALDVKVNGGVSQAGSNKQQFFYFDNYWTQELSDLYASGSSVDVVLRATARHLIALQATKLNEKSMAHCLSMALHTHDLDGDAKLLYLGKLKKFIDAAKNDCAPVGLVEYPEDVNEFIEKAPEAARAAFGATPPVESKFDGVARSLLTTGMPCRSSSHMCATGGAAKLKYSGVPKACLPALKLIEHMQNDGGHKGFGKGNHRPVSMESLPNFSWTQPGSLHYPDTGRQSGTNNMIENNMIALGWIPPAPPKQSEPEQQSPLADKEPPTLDAALPPTAENTTHTNKLIGSDIRDITARITAKTGSVKRAIDDVANESSNSEGDDESPRRPKTKKKAGANAAGIKKPAAATGIKKPAAAPATGIAKPVKAKDIDVKEWLKKLRAALPFPGPKKRKPIHYEQITIYTDATKKKWRVKPGVGRRDEKLISFSSEPRVAWSSVLARAAEYLAASK
jgi:hypothetical protein